MLASAVSLCAALELLVQHRISGFPVVDDNWKLVSFILNLFPQRSYRFMLEYSFCDILLLWNRKRLVHFPLVTWNTPISLVIITLLSLISIIFPFFAPTGWGRLRLWSVSTGLNVRYSWFSQTLNPVLRKNSYYTICLELRKYQVLPPFQIVGHFDKSKYIAFCYAPR